MTEEKVKVFTVKDIPVEKINCTQKGTKVYLDIRGQPIYLRMPKMRVPFNLLDKKNKRTNMIFMKQISFSTEIYEDCDKHNAKYIKKFVEKLKKIDDKIFEELPQFNSERFTKYKSLYSKPDSEYAPMFGVGIKIDNDTLDVLVPVFNNEEQPICVTNSTFKNKIVKGTVKLDNVWISGNRVGISWSAAELELV